MSRINVLVVALLMAVGLSWATQVPVSIVDFAFSPDTVRVNPGDSVVWTNNGAFLHTSTSGVNGVWDSLWDSGDLAHGATFVHGFAVDGTFNYFCRHHYLGGMKGVVVVGAGGVNEAPGAPENVAGIASFPNPFSATATIRFAPAGSASGVTVFDASGRLVRTLPAAHVAFVTWDGKDSRGQETGPGVYFCRYGSGALAVTRLR
ncbi:MAG: plastocyanin/azurin family copper-binding protein [candidate division WOR-3 bacterium]|nr:plastocyanin/azurin family copper-binding protein [candidate division WOR-3 bacterium]